MASLQKHFTKHGNSYALIIDKVLIDLLRMDVTAPVEIISLDGRSLTIRQPSSADLREAVDEIDLRYGKVMKRLAE